MLDELKYSVKKKVRNYYHEIKITIRKLFSKNRKQPDFLIIGVQKGGTSTLFNLLSKHKQIQMPIKKEIHYFDNNYYKCKEWYLAHFPLMNKEKQFITGEASPYYIFHPKAAERIKKDFPNIKIIVLLRNPVMRAYSHFQMEKRRGDERIHDFIGALNIEKERLNIPLESFSNPRFKSFNHQHFSYLARGNYINQLKTWHQYFDKKNLLVLSSEEYFTDQQKVLDKVFDFLELTRMNIKLSVRQNKGHYQKISDEQRQYLNNYFYTSNIELEKLLGQKFSWNKNLDT